MPARCPSSPTDVSQLPRWPTASFRVSWALPVPQVASSAAATVRQRKALVLFTCFLPLDLAPAVACRPPSPAEFRKARGHVACTANSAARQRGACFLLSGCFRARGECLRVRGCAPAAQHWHSSGGAGHVALRIVLLDPRAEHQLFLGGAEGAPIVALRHDPLVRAQPCLRHVRLDEPDRRAALGVA